MNILLVSVAGAGIGLAHRLVYELNSVAVHFQDPSLQNALGSTFSYSDDAPRDAKVANYVIFDGPGMGDVADNLRKEGVKVWGGGVLSDRLETDPNFALDALQRLGVPTGHTNGYPHSMTVEGWFGGKRWNYPFNWTINDHGLLTGDMGAEVDYISSVSRNIYGSSLLASTFLLPLTPLLERAGYTGQFSVDVCFDADGKGFATGVTPRVRTEPTLALMQSFPGYAAAIDRAFQRGFLDLAHGGYGVHQYTAALRLYLPPYPYGTPPAGYEFWGSLVREGFVPHGLVVDGCKMTVAGTSGIVGTTLGRASKLDKALRQCLLRARTVKLPGVSYRLDPGHRVEKSLAAIESMGWLR